MKVRVEWIVLESGAQNGAPILLPARQVGEALTVTSATTTDAVPEGATHARFTVISGNVVIDFGVNASVSQTKGLLYLEGANDALPMRPGSKLSFLEATL